MNIARKPEWLQKRINPAAHAAMEGLLGELHLHTVCQEARCPNITECFRERQATFLILGADCTRLCSFCNVTKRTPLPPDSTEPARVAEAVFRLGLSHVVITSPTRDDLPDGGAGHYAETVAAIRSAAPATKVELLIPDFLGSSESLARVVASAPAIIGHNVETVPRLYDIRAGGEYGRSLRVLRMLGELAPAVRSKSGIMLGLGETEDEVLTVFADLRAAGCSYLGIGQYLAPSRQHHPVREFIRPELFEKYRITALSMGFAHVESGPYVRSSYHAARYDGAP
ncbi:lipoyl synthase [Geobacter benzoatilyticus]|uniref:Lipoyl synthase n=1 Tax=Geobacter benzoatilyticus TaxID=2815309 RepID=A0ABX7Q5C2_9BACT|nr:lipoyl synthase [Geobacter benzoatilyticus]QSV46382.1 lipoyl synthase [Geobacter benzoatilyticus]